MLHKVSATWIRNYDDIFQVPSVTKQYIKVEYVQIEVPIEIEVIFIY